MQVPASYRIINKLLDWFFLSQTWSGNCELERAIAICTCANAPGYKTGAVKII